MAGRLVGKAAIVTGAGQQVGDGVGNGRATAMLFAREGAAVLCVDVVAERAQETAALIAAEGGLARAAQADVSRADDVARLMDEAGDFDILVNNVGVGSPQDGQAHLSTEEAFDRVLAVNLKGAWLMTRAAIPTLRARGGGVILNISSTASLAGAQLIAYETSKAGVNRLTAHVAVSNAAHGIRCNAILPGMMDTPMARVALSRVEGVPPDEAIARHEVHVPLGGKMGTGWDTAYAALFLASDEARFITGVILPVDGGRSTR